MLLEVTESSILILLGKSMVAVSATVTTATAVLAKLKEKERERNGEREVTGNITERSSRMIYSYSIFSLNSIDVNFYFYFLQDDQLDSRSRNSCT